MEASNSTFQLKKREQRYIAITYTVAFSEQSLNIVQMYPTACADEKWKGVKKGLLLQQINSYKGGKEEEEESIVEVKLFHLILNLKSRAGQFIGFQWQSQFWLPTIMKTR